MSATPTPAPPRIAAAIEARKHYAAERALDRPDRLDMAARIVRLALERGRLTVADLTDERGSAT